MIKDKLLEKPKEIRDSFELLILDFSQIPYNISKHKNIKKFFELCLLQGIDPRCAEQRQHFNNIFLKISERKILVGRYGEDRSSMLSGSYIAKEGRTIHLGVDLFTAECEPIYSPFDGEIISIGYEPAPHGYGYWIIIKHNLNGKKLYSFYGHLGKNISLKRFVKAGEKIGNIGDFSNGENGGWSRHLHFQILRELPESGETPPGYASKKDFFKVKHMYPDPTKILGLNIPLPSQNFSQQHP